MSLAYPIARSLEEATLPGAKFARTQREAAMLSPGFGIAGLETSWLHLPEAEALALLGAQGAEGPAGHIQQYEDTSGHLVVAVTWWKLTDPATVALQQAPAEPGPARSDHTDDLYFRRGRTKTKRRKPADPNQLDLFAPDNNS